jgi:hypothetical protein
MHRLIKIVLLGGRYSHKEEGEAVIDFAWSHCQR